MIEGETIDFSEKNIFELIDLTRLSVPRYMIPTPDGQSPYLERLILKPGTFLHLIWESDEDRDPHDHPWDFESKILYGCYIETSYLVEDGKILGERKLGYGPGDTNRKKADELHQLQVVIKPVVTLVTHGPRIRDWGFMTEDGWVHHKPYIEAKTGKPYRSVD